MRCWAHWEDKTNPGFELNCDLDEDHLLLLPFHADKLKGIDWREPDLQPKAVPYTPTGPLPKLKAAV